MTNIFIMKINVIVAYSDDQIIGYDNHLPWSYKEDLRYFRSITTTTDDPLKRNIIIFGYKTYESLNKKPLKDRINIIISSRNNNENDEDLFFADSLGSCMESCRKLIEDNKAEKIFICGGETIYKYFFTSFYYKYLDIVYVTRIKKKYEGNKYFYGLENNFLYLSIKKSIEHPELEYRVLKYQSSFINPEDTFLYYLKRLLKNDSKEDDQFFKFDLDIDLKKYFPIFTIAKESFNDMIAIIFNLMEDKKDYFNNIIYNIKNKNENENLSVNLLEVEPFFTKYNFKVENDKLSCIVEHNIGHILNEVLINIIFSSLITHMISKIVNLEPNIVKYQCKNAYVHRIEFDNLEKMVWDEPDILPILEIQYNKQEKIEDYKIEDMIFLGL